MDYICIDEFQMIHRPKLREVFLTQPMDHQNKSLNFIFPTKYVIPKSLKFSHWPSKVLLRCFKLQYLRFGLVGEKGRSLSSFPNMSEFLLRLILLMADTGAITSWEWSLIPTLKVFYKFF